MGKSIDIFVVDFKNPGQDLPALERDEGGVTCDSSRQFYRAAREKGLTGAVVEDCTVIQYDRATAYAFIQVRNACCIGDACAVNLKAPRSSYCGPQVEEVETRLQLAAPERESCLLLIEKAAQNEESVRCVLKTLAERGHRLNYRLGQPSAQTTSA